MTPVQIRITCINVTSVKCTKCMDNPIQTGNHRQVCNQPGNHNYLQSELLAFTRDPQLNDGDDTISDRISEQLIGRTGDVHVTLLCELEGHCFGEVNEAELLSSSSKSPSDDSDIGDDTVDGGWEGKGRRGALNM